MGIGKCSNKFQAIYPKSAWIYNVKDQCFEARNFGQSKKKKIFKPKK